METASKQNFVRQFETVGPEEFYQLLWRYAEAKIRVFDQKTISPEMLLLNYSHQFMQIYRRENREIYREIAHAFRRAAHRAYRMLLRQKLIKKNAKFLALVE